MYKNKYVVTTVAVVSTTVLFGLSRTDEKTIQNYWHETWLLYLWLCVLSEYITPMVLKGDWL